mmetsp:Transcript_101745/g.283309  ORF Transcript_101745/g.283309 Transcript_101745/m.283309 type:complete len:179 (+) Transcript_101745:70-606(+)
MRGVVSCMFGARGSSSGERGTSPSSPWSHVTWGGANRIRFVRLVSGRSEQAAHSGSAGTGTEKVALDSLRKKKIRSPKDLPSRGSASHALGTCKPCPFVATFWGCTGGLECDFCHLPHTKSMRPPTLRSKKDRLKDCIASSGAQELKKEEAIGPAATGASRGVKKEAPDGEAGKRSAN